MAPSQPPEHPSPDHGVGCRGLRAVRAWRRPCVAHLTAPLSTLIPRPEHLCRHTPLVRKGSFMPEFEGKPYKLPGSCSHLPAPAPSPSRSPGLCSCLPSSSSKGSSSQRTRWTELIGSQEEKTSGKVMIKPGVHRSPEGALGSHPAHPLPQDHVALHMQLIPNRRGKKDQLWP